MKLTKYWQKRRAASLTKQGYTPDEVKAFSKLVFYKTPYMSKERRKRVTTLRAYKAEAQRQHWDKRRFNKEWNAYVLDSYASRGYVLASGKPDFWTFFRAARADAIKRGVWDETPRYRKGSHRRNDASGKGRIDKGEVKRQRQRYADRTQHG